jgi:hypothetical protein
MLEKTESRNAKSSVKVEWWRYLRRVAERPGEAPPATNLFWYNVLT